jgi:hypothetical protein
MLLDARVRCREEANKERDCTSLSNSHTIISVVLGKKTDLPSSRPLVF